MYYSVLSYIMFLHKMYLIDTFTISCVINNRTNSSCSKPRERITLANKLNQMLPHHIYERTIL